jgi:hypothetical protein
VRPAAHFVGAATVDPTRLALRGRAAEDVYRARASSAGAIDGALREHRAEAAGATAWPAVTR